MNQLITIYVKDGGCTETIREPEGCTVAQVRAKLGICAGSNVQVNSRSANESTVLAAGDTVSFIPVHKDKG